MFREDVLVPHRWRRICLHTAKTVTQSAKLARLRGTVPTDIDGLDHLGIHDNQAKAMRLLQRRQFVATMLGTALGATTFTGCNVLNLWKEKEDPNAHLDKLLKVPDMPDLVRQAAVPHGLTFVSVEGVAAVSRLAGTGGTVPPSGLRDELVDEMKKHEVPDPNKFLELPETALVRVQAIIPPGVRRGDPIDLRIISPPQTSATDLHGGWLMDTRLRQQQTLSGMVRKSDVLVVGTGQIFTRADSEGGEDASLKIDGVVLGGGRIQQDRKLGLVIRPEYQHVKLAAKLAESINQRFYFYEGKNRGGIANAREDDFIEIGVHPRYRRNIHRMMAVVGNVVAAGVINDTQHRLSDLGKRLSEPTTAADAAMQLEALGEPAIPTLLEALKNKDAEIRFYAAEALAYLDRTEAILPLEQAAAEQQAFRYSSLIALESMDGRASLDALHRLTNENSIETRYGAFRSIRRRPDGQVIIRPTKMGGVEFYHLQSQGPNFIAISTAERPEIVCFGEDAPIKINDFLMGPGGLIVRPDTDDPSKIRISRFRPGQEDKRAIVSATLSGLINGVTLTGGDYGACVSLLRKAKASQFIACGLAIDPLPQAMRAYHRDDQVSPSDPAELPPNNFTAARPEDSKSSWWAWWKRSDS